MAPSTSIAFLAGACTTSLLSACATRTVCSTRAPIAPARRAAVLHRTTPCCSAAGASAPRARIGAVSVLLIANAVLFALLIYPLMCLVALYGLLLRRDTQSMQQTLLSLYLRLVLLFSFIRVSRHAASPPPRALYVSNHQSALDIFVACATLPHVVLLAPARAFSLPILGWMLSRAGWVSVAGTGRRARMDALSAATTALGDSSVLIFPEGTPAVDGVLRRFPSAVFKTAQAAGVPVVPLTIHGTADMHDGALVPCRHPAAPIAVTVHEAIDTADVDTKDIALRAYSAVRSALPEQLRGESQ